jgi:hypothetical protein
VEEHERATGAGPLGAVTVLAAATKQCLLCWPRPVGCGSLKMR